MGEVAEAVAKLAITVDALEDANAAQERVIDEQAAALGLARTEISELKQALSDCMNGPTPIPEPEPPADIFASRFNANEGSGTFKADPTTSAETWSIVTRSDGTKVIRAKAGGHQPNSGNSTYMRFRAKWPELVGMAFRKWFRHTVTLRLLTDTTHYWSEARTDNFEGTIKGTSTKVGTNTGGEWRVGLMMQPTNVLEFQSTHQGGKTILFKRLTLLPGDHTISYEIEPNIGPAGWWRLVVDGTEYKGTGPTIPDTVPEAARCVTRTSVGIDGANKWTDRPVEVEIVDSLWEARK